MPVSMFSPAQDLRCNHFDSCGHAVGASSWLAMAMFVNSPTSAVAMMMLGSLGTACSDVVVDSIVVERSRGEPQASGRNRTVMVISEHATAAEAPYVLSKMNETYFVSCCAGDSRLAAVAVLGVLGRRGHHFSLFFRLAGCSVGHTRCVCRDSRVPAAGVRQRAAD